MKLLQALAIWSAMIAMAGVCTAQARLTNYEVDARLEPATHKLTATVDVTIVAERDIETAAFELNKQLHVTQVTAKDGVALQFARDAANTNIVRVALGRTLARTQLMTLRIAYSGVLDAANGNGQTGIGAPVSYLLYAARWFPVAEFGTARFTAAMHIAVPEKAVVIASGTAGSVRSNSDGTKTFDFAATQASFPGTMIAGDFAPTVTSGRVHVYATKTQPAVAVKVADVSGRVVDYFRSILGDAPTAELSVVELPPSATAAAWAPGMVAVSSSYFSDTGVVANMIAHQWWGADVSAASRNDLWIMNGLARYSQAMWVEHSEGGTAFHALIADMATGALAYDTTPLAQAGSLPEDSPEFSALTVDKGGMVFHMLRWQIGDDAFKSMLRDLATKYANSNVSTAQFEELAQKYSKTPLDRFFAQWLNGTGAPQLTNTYVVYRLGDGVGYRVVGTIAEDLDLFRMPVELQIATNGLTQDGKPAAAVESKRIETQGATTAYDVQTMGMPTEIAIDPDGWLLTNTAALRVRADVLRGQQLSAHGDLAGALGEFQKALAANPSASLASYRIAEVFFQQNNLQAAADAFRDALRGNQEPKWIVVWSHLELGKVFDAGGQRDRAVNEYRLAIATNDNTGGAVDEARKYLATPYRK